MSTRKKEAKTKRGEIRKKSKVELPPISEFIRNIREQSLALYGREPAAKQLKASSNFLAAVIEDRERFHSFSVENGKVDRFLAAWKTQDDMDRPALVVYPFILGESYLTAASVQRELGKLHSFVSPELRRYMVQLWASQSELKDLLIAQGFKVEAYELVGRVDNALEYFGQRQKLSHFRISVLKPKTEMEEALDVIQAAHTADPTSRGDMGTKRSRDKMREHLKGMSKDGLLFVAKSEGRIVGEVGLRANYGRRDQALLGTISVHPNFQGKGLSSLLYWHGLKAAQKKGARFWLGFSSTSRVLANQEKLGRKVKSMTLYLPAKGAQIG